MTQRIANRTPGDARRSAPAAADDGVSPKPWLAHVQRATRGRRAAQEVTTRRPGRMNDAETSYVSTADLEAAFRRAEAAHREHEKRSGTHLLHRSGQHDDWPAWYASYMVAEQAGTDLPS